MSLKHILLGLLRTQPASGYDLKKRLLEQGRHFWNTDQSQIYRALYKMRDKGWVDVILIPQEKNPDRKEYSITDTGLSELTRWLTEDFQPLVPPQTWLTYVYFAAELPPDTVRQRIVAQITESQAMLKWAQNNLAHVDAVAISPDDKRLRALTYRYHVDTLERQIKWLQNILIEVDNPSS